MNRRAITGVLTTLLAVASLNCTIKQPPNTDSLSLEATAAVYGRQVIAGMSSAATGIDLMLDTKVLTREDGLAALEAMLVASQEAQRLAEALRVLDQAKTDMEHQNSLGKVRALTKALQAAISKVLIPIATQYGREQVQAILQPVSDLLLDMSTGLLRLGPPGDILAAA